MAPRKPAPSQGPSGETRPRPPNAKRSSGLADLLDRPEVLLACFYRTTVSALSDRPDEVEALLREAVGTPVAAQRRALARSLRNNVGIVRWSEAHQCLWFKQGRGAPYRVHPSRITAEQRAHVATVEPRTPIRSGHAAEHPPPDDAAPR
jgi:hypothetical protein